MGIEVLIICIGDSLSTRQLRRNTRVQPGQSASITQGASNRIPEEQAGGSFEHKLIGGAMVK